MPQAYHVLPDDDVNAVLRVVKEHAGQRLSLILSPRSPLFLHDVTLRLLKRYAEEDQVELEIVTDDSAIRTLAASVGLTVRPRSEEQQSEQDEPKEHGRGDTRTLIWTRRLVILSIVAGALLGLFYTLSPKVSITVVPASTMIEVRTAVPLRGGPALPIERLDTIETLVSVATMGRSQVGVTPARGVVVFLNAGEASVRVPKGTRVLTQSGQAFTTDAEVSVPGRQVAFFLDVPVGVQSGRAEVSVTAESPGTEGNVGPERVRLIEGDWPELSVRNLEPFTGGTDAALPAVSAADVEAVRAEARSALERERERLIEALQASLARHTLLDWEWVDEVQIEGVQSVGTLVATVEGVVKATLRTRWVDPADFSPILEQTIPERVPIGYTWDRNEGFSVVVEGYDSEREELRVRAQVPLRPIIDGVRLAQEVAGQPVIEAIAHLKQESGVVEAMVHPAGVERLPRWAPWIRIEVDTGRRD